MDSEIMSAFLKINSLLSAEERIEMTDSHYEITDLYLIPVRALKEESTRTTAIFCLGVAALIDLLSLLLAVSLRKRKPLWKRHSLLFCNPEDYLPQIYATLPGRSKPEEALADFLTHFAPSPETERDGYMMRAKMRELEGFFPLAALLCQINLAKLVPAGFLEQDTEILLLRARFVFWANEVIYEDACERKEATA